MSDNDHEIRDNAKWCDIKVLLVVCNADSVFELLSEFVDLPPDNLN
jgi:hypothetical protein